MASQGPYDHKCHLCSKSFTRSFNLRSHLDTHSGVKPFPCSFCDQRFTRNHDRKFHEKEKHSPTKQYPCRGQFPNGEVWGCDSVFARKATLQRHLNSNIGRACRPPLNESSSSASHLAPSSAQIPADSQAPDFSFAPSTVVIAASARRRGSMARTNFNTEQALPPSKISGSVSVISMKLFHHSPSMWDAEVILLQTKTYFTSYIAVQESREVDTSPVPPRQYESKIYDFWKALKLAIRLLDKGVALRPWQLINKGCEWAGIFLRQQHQAVLPVLLLAFGDRRWAKFPDLRFSLLKYLTGMAQKVLAVRHPMTTILQFLQKDGALINSTEPAIGLMLDMITGPTGRLGDEAYVLKICLEHLLVMQKKFHVPIKANPSLKADGIALYGDYDSCEDVHWKPYRSWKSMARSTQDLVILLRPEEFLRQGVSETIVDFIGLVLPWVSPEGGERISEAETIAYSMYLVAR